MRKLFRQLLKISAYLAATVVILLAVAVGLFRLFLPRLPEYQEEIKSWANAAIGMQVEFSGMNARWRLSGPELNFYNAELLLPGEQAGVLAADEVSVGVDLMQLLLDRRFVVDRVMVRESSVSIERSEDGSWQVQDMPLATLTEHFSGQQSDGRITLQAEDVDVTYRHPPRQDVARFAVGSLRMTRRERQIEIDALLELPQSLGNRLRVSVVGDAGRSPGNGRWQYLVDSTGLNLAGWSGLQPSSWPTLAAGRADLSLSVEQLGSEPRNAVIDFDVTGLQAAGEPEPFGAEGRLEYQLDSAGWLLVVNDLRLRTGNGTWPAATVNVQGNSDDGELQSLTATASYLHLGDLRQLLPWLPEKWAGEVRQRDASGSVENLSASLAEAGSDSPRYDIALDLRNAGMRASDSLPGIRGFSGSLRANRSGGRLQIESTAMTLDLARWLRQPVDVGSAEGTIIWRRGPDGITVLSDSILLQNADLTSRSSVQLSLPADDSSPVLDLESRWSIGDLSVARNYLPASYINPGLYRWLSSALVAGSVPVGTTRFSGPLEDFPFDDGNGVFRIEATLQDATLRYSELWPDVENLNLDLVVDRTRLYSVNNTALNAGNSVVDAKIEIADLREPVLEIDAFATGTLESIRQFARRSPVADVFGGHLDRVAVEGDASFNLLLNYPILRRDEYSFTTRIRANDGTLHIDGFAPPVSELNGVVSVSRDDISTESLFGRFLGEPVDIELHPAGDESPGYSVTAEVAGRVTASGLSDAFGVGLAQLLSGGSDYRGRIRFPRATGGQPAPLQIAVESQLDGLTIDLPEPFAKERSAQRGLAATIEFPQRGRIETRGSLGDGQRWTLAFVQRDFGWDFDRGVLAVGGAYPGNADTRGLHISGATPVVRLREWLALAGGSDGGGFNLAERVRSVDLDVQDLYVLGQHFEQHRVAVDRSGTDWVVQVDGPQASGNASIPYDFGSGRTLTLDMQRLILPGSDESGEATAITTDPRRVPPVSLKAGEFALGSRHLGRLEAEFERTPDGLVASNVRSEDDSFVIEGSAGWVVDTREPSGQRTWARATLRSNDVAATMRRLNSRPGLEGEDMEIGFDVSWSGGPREDFLQSLDGDVTVRLGTGQLDEVEPGAGRMFGLLSVVALPRRLALDFRDVLDRGFVFDEITGTFRLDDGDAYTCDLSLKGPAADIGIVGRAGLVEKDYNQAAIVSANVGNTLPVVGAVVAGPQVAAALLIFSQIFKKPLQEMGQVYYGIDGSWDQPQVDNTNAARFASASQLASCLENGA